MKKMLMMMLISTMSICAQAQKEIRAGKLDDVEVSTKLRLKVGTELKALKVTEAADASLIGKPIICRVMESRRSNITGLEGHLVLRPLYIDNNGTRVDLEHDDIYLRGKNRGNVKFWTSWTIVMAVFPGQGAKVKKNDSFILYLK
ncbi:MAG: hypothetical protein IJK45_02980 [Bacteroidaceae bacterium]|nr:hypothetical protein [Bacteroidaceae bacterium]